jgi:undecaprenyl-diphosphatase
MQSPEIALFLWANAGPQTPAVIIELARLASKVLPALSIVLLALATVRGSRQLRVAAVQTGLALALGWVVTHWLRDQLQIPRPAAFGLGRQWIPHSDGNGFPSLHATGAFAFAVALLRARLPRAVVATAFASALLITWSRLCLGVHFPADVLAGAVVGSAAACTVHALWSWVAARRAAVPAPAAVAVPIEPLQPAAPAR